MSRFVMLTRLESSNGFESLEQVVANRIRRECQGVNWLENLAVMGPMDYVDVFEAPDNDTAMKVAAIVRGTGHAHAEVWPATEWEHYKQITHGL